MYKKGTKYEIAASALLSVISIIYRILEDTDIHIIPSEAMLILWLITIGYVFFNRSIKLLINSLRNRRNFCISIAEITDIKHFYMTRGGYDYYIIKYEYRNKSYSQEVHSSFSITKWKIGDRIKIKVDRNAPDNIIVMFSDLAMAVLTSIIGIILTGVPIVVYIKTH